MNILNNFREFLATGEEQLLDIFEDNGEEKPEPVEVHWKSIWIEDIDDHYYDDLSDYEIISFSTRIQAEAYTNGLNHNRDRTGQFLLCVGFSREEFLENLQDLLKDYVLPDTD